MQEQEIIQSPLMAKSVIISGKQIEIVAVFEKSEFYKCFFTFTAEKPNAKQSEWKRKGYYSIYAGTYMTLDDFVAREIKFNFKNAVTFVETKLNCKPEELRAFLDKVAHPFDHLKRVVPKGATFDIVNRKQQKAMKNGFWFANRNRAFDSLPTSKDEVLFYQDFCEECGKSHSIAHFPDGHTKCMDMVGLQNNPGLEYTGHQDGVFKFRYRFTATVTVRS